MRKPATPFSELVQELGKGCIMSNHTPGPWLIEIERELGITMYYLGSTAGAEMGDEARANARLIAASPELLELGIKAMALIAHGIAEHAYGDIVSGPGYAKRILDGLEATIAKAEGRE